MTDVRLSQRLSVPYVPGKHRKLFQELTLTQRALSPLAQPGQLHAAQVQDGRLFVPKAWGLLHLKELCGHADPDIDDLQSPGAAREPYELMLPRGLRPHQATAADAVMTAMLASPLGGGGLLVMGCGAGKSVTALEVVARLGLKCAIVVHTGALAEQWCQAIEQYVPDPVIGRVVQNKFDVEGKTHVIVQLQSASRREYDWANAGIQVLVVDECLPYEQRIATDRGPMKIGQLYNMWRTGATLPLVRSLEEETGTWQMKRITHAFRSSDKPLLKVDYGKGCFKCTPNHRVLTTEGYTAAGELRPGDLLVATHDTSLAENMSARTLNGDQYQIMLGSFLGDGSMQLLPSARYRLKVQHGSEQEEYCAWKAGMFDADVQHIEVNGYAQTPAVRFITKVIDMPRDKRFPSSKSTCPQWVLDDLDERGLAIWWMDDGSLSRTAASGTISTHSFDEDSHIRIQRKLLDMGIECVIVAYRSGTPKIIRQSLRLNECGITALLSMVAPYAHASMEHKFTNHIIEARQAMCESSGVDTSYDRLQSIPERRRREGAEFIVKGKRYTYMRCTTCDGMTFHLNGPDGGSCLHSRVRGDVRSQPPMNVIPHIWSGSFLDTATLCVRKVTDIGDVESVFDLEVEDNHNFVACTTVSCIGPVVHNCHHISAPTFSEALAAIGGRYRLGLSATPTRADGLSAFLEWSIGPVLFKTAREKRGDLRAHAVILRDGPTRDLMLRVRGKECANVAGMLNLLQGTAGRAAERQSLVASWLRLCCSKGRMCMVLSDRISLLRDLGDRLVSSLKVGYMIGAAKKAEREAAKTADVVLASYAICSEGVDIPILDTLVLLTPRSGAGVVEQCVGRLLREGGRPPLVIDFVDGAGVFQNMFKKRSAVYRKMGATITRYDELRNVIG